MVDGAAFDYCRVTALHAPQDWESDISNKQVPLSVVRGASFDEVRGTKLEEYLKDLEIKSLKEKIDRLHARCRALQCGAWLPEVLQEKLAWTAS